MVCWIEGIMTKVLGLFFLTFISLMFWIGLITEAPDVAISLFLTGLTVLFVLFMLKLTMDL